MIIADYGNHRIVEWKRGATSGTVLAGGNGQGDRPDQLYRPTDVIFDKVNGSLIICDNGNSRVTRWPRRSGVQKGGTIIDKIDCYGLTIDDEGSLYVTDEKKHEVRRYRRGETSGTVVVGGKKEGANLHQLNWPTYVCLGAEHAVYVSDSWNHRVMKWVKDGKEGSVVAGGWGHGNGLRQLSHPNGVLIDAAGTVYVADSSNDRVIRWCCGATQGTVAVGGNGRGERANQLNYPMGLSFDHQGHLYVADHVNHRVQRFFLENN